jgi:hypothetical protein
MLPSFVFAFSRLSEASATSLRSGCSPLPLLSRGVELRGILRSACYPLPFLSRRRQLRGISLVRMLPGFVFAFSRLSKLPRHHSGLDVARCLFVLVGVSSAASLRSGCYPASSLLSRGFSKLPRHLSGQDAPRCLFVLVGVQLRGISQVSMLPLSVTARTARPALSRRVLPLV